MPVHDPRGRACRALQCDREIRSVPEGARHPAHLADRARQSPTALEAATWRLPLRAPRRHIGAQDTRRSHGGSGHGCQHYSTPASSVERGITRLSPSRMAESDRVAEHTDGGVYVAPAPTRLPSALQFPSTTPRLSVVHLSALPASTHARLICAAPGQPLLKQTPRPAAEDPHPRRAPRRLYLEFACPGQRMPLPADAGTPGARPAGTAGRAPPGSRPSHPNPAGRPRIPPAPAQLTNSGPKSRRAAGRRVLRAGADPSNRRGTVGQMDL